MLQVGLINREIYSCVTEHLVTDEVVLTDERIAHICERHPLDAARYMTYIPEIIADPDYILQANSPNTVFLLKKFQNAGEHFELILRLKIESDPPAYKNSVITFLHIREKAWHKYLRNKKILYRKE